jgi:23S rRNA (guanosine2251-2'-O)-methyltransferase
MAFEQRRQFDRRPRPADEGQMVYGIRPVLEALEAGREIERIYIHRGAGSPLMAELKKALKERDIVYQEVPVEKLNRLTRKNHQDVICFISPIIYQKLQDVLPGIYESGQTPFLLLLDRITDVRNFGAIARTAECAGVHALVIPSFGSARISADALKTSAGALNNIPVCRERSLADTVDYLHDAGLQVVAVTEKGAVYPQQHDLTGPTAFIMGSEEDGISSTLLERCDHRLRIPLFGKTGSLNVSVACGIVLYEVVRQRMQ